MNKIEASKNVLARLRKMSPKELVVAANNRHESVVARAIKSVSSLSEAEDEIAYKVQQRHGSEMFFSQDAFRQSKLFDISCLQDEAANELYAA